MAHDCCFKLEDSVVVLTGASSGLGERFARCLHTHGARLVIAARREDRLGKLALELGENVVTARCDVTNEQDRRDLLRSALDGYGRVDVLINNAGMGNVVDATNETEESFVEVLQVNLVSTFTLSTMFARHWLQSARHGNIVNVASIFGFVGVGQIPQAGYAASKAGVINLSRELSAQWGRRGIRVNALAPGFFPSEQTDEMLADDRGQRWIKRRTILGRPGEDDELDGALLFLAGPLSSYVVGQTLVVDGGFLAL